MFQDYALFPHRNVYDNVAFGLRMSHLDKGTVQRRVAEMLDLVGLTGYETAPGARAIGRAAAAGSAGAQPGAAARAAVAGRTAGLVGSHAARGVDGRSARLFSSTRRPDLDVHWALPRSTSPMTSRRPSPSPTGWSIMNAQDASSRRAAPGSLSPAGQFLCGPLPGHAEPAARPGGSHSPEMLVATPLGDLRCRGCQPDVAPGDSVQVLVRPDAASLPLAGARDERTSCMAGCWASPSAAARSK
jgi:hypothetical protein